MYRTCFPFPFQFYIVGFYKKNIKNWKRDVGAWFCPRAGVETSGTVEGCVREPGRAAGRRGEGGPLHTARTACWSQTAAQGR